MPDSSDTTYRILLGLSLHRRLYSYPQTAKQRRPKLFVFTRCSGERGLLPTELIQHIYSYITGNAGGHTTFFQARRTVTACALVCRAWYACAVDILYTDVRLPTVQSTQLLAQTLRSRPDLATRIRSLRLPGAEGNTARDPRDALADFGRQRSRARSTLPVSFSKLLALCSTLRDLHVNLAPMDDPVPALVNLFAAVKQPAIQRLWIVFNQRAGFGQAPWSVDGILFVLSHKALSSLSSFSLGNVLITFGRGIPLPLPKTLPPLRALRLHNVSALGPLDQPVRELIQPIRSTLTSVDIIHSSIMNVDWAFSPVKASLLHLGLWLLERPDASLDSFTHLTQLRIGHNISALPADVLPPRLNLLIIDVSDCDLFDLYPPDPPSRFLLRYIMYILPAHPSLRDIVLQTRVRMRQLRLLHAFATLCALGAEEVGLSVRTEVALVGGQYFARPPTPGLPLL